MHPFKSVRFWGMNERMTSIAQHAVHSQLPMALSAACLVYACSRVLGTVISPWWYLVATMGTWTIYLLDSTRSRNAEDQLSQPQRAALFQRSHILRTLLPWITGSVGVIATLLAKPDEHVIWVLIVLGLLGIAYAVPLLPEFKSSTSDSNPIQFRTLKHFALLKPLTICLAWILGAILIPLCASESCGDTMSPMRALWLALLIGPLLLGDTLLLDLRDRDGDRAAGISTFVVRVSPITVHTVVGLCLGISALIFLAGAHDAPKPEIWKKVGLAGIIGLSTAWFGWPALQRSESGTAFGLMAWRFLAALAAL